MVTYYFYFIPNIHSLSEGVRTAHRAANMKGSDVRLRKLLRAYRRGDVSKGHTIRALRKGVVSRAKFFRIMTID